jgi:hypothetical protein
VLITVSGAFVQAVSEHSRTANRGVRLDVPNVIVPAAMISSTVPACNVPAAAA